MEKCRLSTCIFFCSNYARMQCNYEKRCNIIHSSHEIYDTNLNNNTIYYSKSKLEQKLFEHLDIMYINISLVCK